MFSTDNKVIKKKLSNKKKKLEANSNLGKEKNDASKILTTYINAREEGSLKVNFAMINLVCLIIFFLDIGLSLVVTHFGKKGNECRTGVEWEAHYIMAAYFISTTLLEVVHFLYFYWKTPIGWYAMLKFIVINSLISIL